MLKSMIAMPRSSVSSSFAPARHAPGLVGFDVELVALCRGGRAPFDLLDDEGVKHVGGSIGRWGCEQIIAPVAACSTVKTGFRFQGRSALCSIP